MENIYLCGFKGTRIREIGQQLAYELGFRFLDFEAFMEKKAGKTIAEIRRHYGEESYHSLLSQFIIEIAKMEHAVVAVGNDVFAFEDNIVTAQESGHIVYLYLPFEVCLKRIKGCRQSFRGYTQKQLSELYKARHTIYKIAASITFDAVHEPKRAAHTLAQRLSK